MKIFHCNHCRQLVFFENIQCVKCGHALAYLPDQADMAQPRRSGRRGAGEAEREKRRQQMGEPYRTLLGHFRHEIGHYYWDRLIDGSTRIDRFRQLFGDEWEDYGKALQSHYENGAPADWQARYVSQYASSHPWEDWAETFAHYLHLVDTLETAAACGLSLKPPGPDEPSLELDRPEEIPDQAFNALMESWFPLTYVHNNLNRGMGLLDAYPFILRDAAIDKLRFVHYAIGAA